MQSCRRNLWVALIGAIVSAVCLPQPGQAQTGSAGLLDQVTDCDLLAAHPEDLQRMAEGVADDRIVPRIAIVACEQASGQTPGEARLAFQLGRALLAGHRKAEAFTQFERAAKAGHAASWAYLGDAYQFGNGVQGNLELALDAYRKAEAGGFEPAKALVEQITFDKGVFTLDVLGALFERRLGDLAGQADSGNTKWPMRGYVFALTQRFVSECGRVLAPANIAALYRFRFGSGWTSEQDAQINMTVQTAIGEFDANTFLRRHGCEGPVAKHVFAMLDQFLTARRDM